MRRAIGHTFAAASALGCLLALGLWGRSVFVTDVVRRERPTAPDGFKLAHSVYARRGVIVFAHDAVQAPGGLGPPGRPIVWTYEARPERAAAWPPGDRAEDRRRLGFAYHHLAAPRSDPRTGRPLFEGTSVAVPYWFVAAGLAIGPWRWTAARRRERRALRDGRCARCGYDLRATPGRCPECGAAGAAAAG